MASAGLRIFIAGLFIALILTAVSPVQAAKKRVRRASTSRATSAVAFSRARLSRPTNSVVVTFLNLNQVRRVDYVLSYAANGVQQGVVGAFSPSGQTTDERDLYFGTCSRGVCTPHYNITSATLTVTARLTSGATHVKRYRIKV